jgi:predicted  nucleic acid-binding Zn-ribbon protein
MPVKPIDTLPEPPRQGKPGGLGDKLQNALERFVVGVFNKARYGISDTLRHAVDNILETLERPLLGYVNPLIDDILKIDGIPASLRSMLARAKTGQDQVGVAILMGVAAAAIMYLGPAALSGIQEKMRQASFNLFNPNLLDFGTWWNAQRRAPGYRARMMQELAWQGWTEEQVRAAELVAQRVLSVGEILVAYHRGQIGHPDSIARLRALGYEDREAAILFNLGEQLPSPSDLVRFAVREAWRDDVAAAWGFDQGRPGQFDEYMKKQGFPSWVSQAEWRSHWQLPSVSMGTEMLFRGEIRPEQFRQLLVMLDIAPGWIPKVEAIARPLPGRIDRRWAYEEGIIKDKELKDLYLADGMTEFWADAMTRMIVSKSAEEAKGLTRAAVQAAYKKRRLSRQEALNMMADLGIQASIATWYLQQADLDRSQELLDQQVDNVKARYLNNLIGDNQALEEQGALGVGGEEARVNLESWQLAKRVKISSPTRTNLDEFFKQGVIGVDQYRDQMRLLGYADQYVGWYLGSLAFETAQARAAEEERAQKERVRLAAERRATAYERAKAEIDQNIAELNAAIADAQVAVVELENERDLALSQTLSAREIAALEREYQPLFREADAAIAQARLSQDQLRTSVTERRAQVNDLKRGLAAGRDLIREQELTKQRVTHQLDLARLDREIARKRTDIAILREAIPQMESAEERGQAELDILTLQREIRELEEQQAETRIAIEEIDGQLPAQLSAERRVEVQQQIDALQAEIDALEVEIDQLTELIRETQVERQALDGALEEHITALPSRAEQIDIRARFDARIDEVRARIQELRANIADLRVAKTRLTVEWRVTSV